MTTYDHGPDSRWKAGPRVRVDAMRAGTRFLAYDGTVYTTLGREHVGAHYVSSDGGETCFAGCAEGVVLGEESRT